MAESPPSQPPGAVPYRPTTGVPDSVERMEIALVSPIEARFKPVDWTLYALPSTVPDKDIWTHYESGLAGWQPIHDWSDRDTRYRIWTLDDRILGVALASDTAEPGTRVLMVLTGR